MRSTPIALIARNPCPVRSDFFFCFFLLLFFLGGGGAAFFFHVLFFLSFFFFGGGGQVHLGVSHRGICSGMWGLFGFPLKTHVVSGFHQNQISGPILRHPQQVQCRPSCKLRGLRGPAIYRRGLDHEAVLHASHPSAEAAERRPVSRGKPLDLSAYVWRLGVVRWPPLRARTTQKHLPLERKETSG